MPIKIKNSELTNETISALNILIDTDINATCAFRLSRIIKELTSIVEDKNKMETKDELKELIKNFELIRGNSYNNVEKIELK